jgi:cytoskeleton protein RodZ
MADTLGSILRKKRESLGLTLEKVEGAIRIRIKHLQAIESDDLSSIPSVAQARGFIRNYAIFLGLNPDEILAAAGGTRPRPSPAPAAEPGPPPTPTSADPGSTRPRPPITAPVVPRTLGAAPSPVPVARTRSWLRLDTILSGGVTLVVLALLAWGGYHVAQSVKGPTAPTEARPSAAVNSETPTAAAATSSTLSAVAGGTVPAGSEEQTPQATAYGYTIAPGTAVVATLEPTTIPTPLGGVYTDVRIHIIVLQRAYLEVEVDGKIDPPQGFSGRVLTGETYDFIGQRTVKISTGNGAGIRVIFNGVDEGPMGRIGQVVSVTYSPSGVITPIPSLTLTPTATPTPTVSPKP